MASPIEVRDAGVVEPLPPRFSSLGRAKSEEDDVCVRVVPKLHMVAVAEPAHAFSAASNSLRV